MTTIGSDIAQLRDEAYPEQLLQQAQTAVYRRNPASKVHLDPACRPGLHAEQVHVADISRCAAAARAVHHRAR